MKDKFIKTNVDLFKKACGHGHKGIVVLLIKNNASIHEKDKYGQFALFYGNLCYIS